MRVGLDPGSLKKYLKIKAGLCTDHLEPSYPIPVLGKLDFGQMEQNYVNTLSYSDIYSPENRKLSGFTFPLGALDSFWSNFILGPKRS